MHEYAKRKNGPEGWFDIRSSLCIWLGTRLAYMSKHCRTYPNGTTHEQWRDDLGTAAAYLLDHGEKDADGDADDASVTMAKEALEWVTKNLESLWD